MKHYLTILLATFQTANCFGQDGYIKGTPSLAYWKVGNEKSIVIVLHGGPAAQHEYLRPEFDALSAAAEVIYYDQRGCGKSDRADSYLWQEHLSDLRRVVQTFSKKRKVFLAGSSWGSTLAIIYAYTYPEDVKGVVLSGTYQWEGRGKTYSRTTRLHHYPPHKQSMQEHRLLTDSTSDGQTLIEISKEFEISSGSPLGETRASFISGPPLDSLKNVNTPILIFNGDWKDCGIDRGHEFVKAFPNAQLYTIPGACHDPWFSRPDLFFAKCEEFITKETRKKRKR